ncbi:hypothetical protein DL764_009856 [Monosporascus ibericus]|uniref:Major facilitator superfamily (MFS) profile domain-containing protein n=1 Tax=Monosporascus ibericus TaxID=155417 RepID=A0A4Q4SWR0_9PEZI|nr:hypothetical protein DL764_009856 [Monosporascus ibericus]
MVAILEIGALISSLAVGRVGDIIGRRRTILYGSIIFFVGGALQSFADNMAMMMLGRIIAGLGVGSLSTIVPVYQSEISPPHNRGQLACIEFSGNIIGYATSVWVDYGCGFIESNWSWRLPLLMQCVMGALLGLGSLIIVESPRWLLDNDHDEEGIVVIANLYGGGDIHNPKARDEYREIKMNVLLQRMEGERSYSEMFRRYKTRVFIAMSAQALAQLNGINVISYYAPYVFESAGWIGHDAIFMAGINGITYFLSTIPPCFVVVYFIYPETCGVRLEDMDSLFGDASTAMGTPGIRSESDANIRPGSPIPSLDLRGRIASDANIPPADVEPPTVNMIDGRPRYRSESRDSRGRVGEWLTRMVGQNRGGSPASGARYTPIDQRDD